MTALSQIENLPHSEREAKPYRLEKGWEKETVANYETANNRRAKQWLIKPLVEASWDETRCLP